MSTLATTSEPACWFSPDGLDRSAGSFFWPSLLQTPKVGSPPPSGDDAAGRRGVTARIRHEVREIVDAPDFVGVIDEQVLAGLAASEGRDVDEALMDLLPSACQFAQPELSGYAVGAVALGASGRAYLGANLEFRGATMRDTMHAEQSATMNAWVHGERQLSTIALTAPPCGHCRQFFAELSGAEQLRLLIRGEAPTTLNKLLPLLFGPAQLKKRGRLLGRASHPVHLIQEPADDVIRAALAAARASYAPYTGAYAGVALQTARRIYTGRYAENAAFNPAVSPLGAALAVARLGGEGFSDIRRAVLVASSSPIDHHAQACQLLSAVSRVRLEIHEPR
ncbi:MAG: cytidine deaminase [Acidimicrobiia bacterium]